MHIVFACGGSPGQLFGGLSVAHQIRATQPRARIAFVGGGKDFESRNATLAGFQYVTLPGRCAESTLGAAWRQLTGSSNQRAARRLLHRWQPDVVVGLGDCSAAPMVRAALAMGTPVVLIEYNAIPSRLTEKFGGQASVVCTGFDALREHLSAAGAVQTVGNPIRAAFGRVFRRRLERLARPYRTRSKAPGPSRTLVVLAGTAGSRAMNEHVPKALYRVRNELSDWRVIHQAGSRERKKTQSLYQKLGISAEVTSYISDMPRVLLTADVAVSRGGGVTLSELSAAGVPTVVLPSAKPGNDHESANAAIFAGARASRTVIETEGDIRLDYRLGDVLGDLLASSSVRWQMSAAMLAIAKPKAAGQVASLVSELAHDAALQGVA
jgi:UDP-N-acetylglucosamine--N-acetylmuramyl-(pentapeptide) pyrophosphoryl-undecaprenol N-acetylglucosamine transferase